MLGGMFQGWLTSETSQIEIRNKVNWRSGWRNTSLTEGGQLKKHYQVYHVIRNTINYT